MKFSEFIRDKKYMFLFYLVLMSLISLILYLDPTRRIDVQNLIYLNFISLVLLLIYLVGEYLIHRRFYQTIEYIADEIEKDQIYSLPQPNNCEQKLYLRLLEKIWDGQNQQLEGLYQDKRDNLDFVTSWVHEIKTPIAASRLVIENNTGKPMVNILESLEEELDKIEVHVERALYYARIDAFHKDYFISEVCLEQVVKTAVKKNAKTFVHKKIGLDLEDLDLNVLTDRKWLLFIIDQILINSLKYTAYAGRIKVYTKLETNEKQLIIEDNGIGIKFEDLARVFDKGFTGYTGREDYKSTGLGLYLARMLAQKLKHDISIESVFGEYTKVIIHFPKLNDYMNVT